MMPLGTAMGALRLDISDFMGPARAAQAQMGLLGRAGDSISRIGRQFEAVGKKATLGFTVPILGAGVAMFRAAGDFEQGMNRVLAITDASEEQFGMLRTQAIDLAKVTKFTAREVSEGMSFLAMAGFDTNEIYAAMPGVLSLAAAGSLDLGRSADIVSNIMQSMQLEATETGRAVDVLVSAFTGSNVDVEMLGEAFKYVGPLAQQAGWSIEQTAAAIGLLGDAGIQGSMAGTSMRNWIVRLMSPTAAAANAMDRLGVSVIGLDGNLKSPVELVREFEGAAQRLGVNIGDVDIDALSTQFGQLEDAVMNAGYSMEDFEALTWDEKVQAMSSAGYDLNDMLDAAGGNVQFLSDVMEIFGIRGGPAFLALLARGSGDLGTFTDRLMQAGGTADRVAQTMMKGLYGSLLILKSAWEAWMIRLGDAGALDIATGAVQGLTRAIDWLTGRSEASQQRMLLVLGALALLGPGMVAFGSALRAVGWAMNALGFRSLLGNLMRLSPWLLAIGAGVAAWKSDFMGVRSIVGGFASDLREGWSAFQYTFAGDGWRKLNNWERATYAVGHAFGVLANNAAAPQWLRSFAANMRDALPHVRNFGQFLGDVWNGSPRKAMASLELLPPTLQRIAKNLAPAVTGISSLVRAFSVGGFEAALRQLPHSLDGVRQSFAAFRQDLMGELSLKDWLLDVAVPRITGWLVDTAPDVWAGLTNAAGWVWDRVVNLRDWTLDTAVPAITGWLRDVAPDVWGGITSLSGWVWDGIGELLDWSLEVGAPEILDLIWDMTELILEKIGDVVVSVYEWMLTLDTERLAVEIVDLAPAILKAVGLVLLAGALVFTGAWVLGLGGVPLIVIGFGLAALVMLALGREMPESVEQELQRVVITGLGMLDWAVDLMAEIQAELFRRYPAPAIDIVIGLSVAWKMSGIALEQVPIIGDLIKAGQYAHDIKIGIEEWSWPDLPEWSWPDWDWPSLPSWSWPEIPMPSWWFGGGGDDPDFSGGGKKDGGSDGGGRGFGDEGGNIAPSNVALALSALKDYRDAITTTRDTVKRDGPSEWAGQFTTSLPQIPTAVTTNITGLLPPVQTAFTGIGDIVKTTMPQMASTASTNFSAINTEGSGNIRTLGGNVTGDMGTMSASSLAHMGAMAAGSIGSASTMNTGVTGETSGMTGISLGLFGQIAGGALAQSAIMAREWTGGAQRSRAGVNEGLSPIPGIVSSIGGTAAANAYGAGLNISTSLARGIWAGIPEIRAAAAAAASAANEAARAGFGIASPSRVWTAMADNVTGTFANVMETGAGKMAEAAVKVARAVNMAAASEFAADGRFWDARRQAWVTTFRDVAGGSASSPGETGRQTGTTPPPTAAIPDKDDWKDLTLTGIAQGAAEALRKLGLGTDLTVSSLWNEVDWLARVEELGETAARDINDLFHGRVRLNESDWLLMGGKYLEHYGSPVKPNPVLDGVPGRPVPPSTPNNGSPGGGAGRGHGYVMVREGDRYTIITPDSEQFSSIAKNAKRGNTAYGAVGSMGVQRVMTQGARRPIVKG